MQTPPIQPFLDSTIGSSARALDEWRDNCAALRLLIESGPMDNFLRSQVIRGTMFASSEELADAELRSLQGRPDFSSRWAQAINEHPLGSPPLMRSYPLTSTNRVHKAHALAVLEDAGGLSMADASGYFEFGAGYGATVAIARALGLVGPAYLIDLPAFSALQQWYLSSTGVPGVNYYSSGAVDGMNRFLEALRERDPASIFISTWALSEAPLDAREQVLQNLGPGFVLIAAQPTFGGTNNIEYFESRLPSFSSRHTWRVLPVLGLAQHRYFLGTPRP